MLGAPSHVYEPLNEYKLFAPGIGIVDGPFEYVSALGMKLPWPFTTRMTVVQLQSGDLFLHSPTAYDAALANRLQSLGRVRHLVSPNRGHYAHIGEWQRAFPNAIAWASPRVRERARAQRIDIHFDGDLGPNAPNEWHDDMDQAIIPGAVLHEVVFFHRRSKTLILADTIMNFELERMRQPYRFIARVGGICSPSGGMPFDLRLALWPSRDKVRRTYERIMAWQPERIILSHGRCFETNGTAAIRRAFSWAL
ncbi:MAG TPA: DUF4336 domain-containing protein [Xanthobacteraceae bacterium]|jgi:hypothetical protein